MSDYEKISKGEQAARYLADPLFMELVLDIRERAVKSLIECPECERVDHIAMIRAVESLRHRLQSIVTTGKNAAGRG